jgi:hypothetical protein
MKAIGQGAKELDDRAMMYLYLEALKAMGEGQGSKILFPAEFTKILGGVGANLAKTSLAGQDVNALINQVKDAFTKTQ